MMEHASLAVNTSGQSLAVRPGRRLYAKAAVLDPLRQPAAARAR
jgi:hypothetical protein